MGFQPKVTVNIAKSTGITLYDTTGDYHAVNNPTGYGAPNPLKADIQAILTIQELLGSGSPSTSKLTAQQESDYLDGTTTPAGSAPGEDGVFEIGALIGFAAPATLSASQGTGQFLLANASAVFLEAVGFTIDSLDTSKLYRIDRTKVLTNTGGYVTENLPVIANLAITIYYEAKTYALVYNLGEACLLEDIADAKVGCGCSQETTNKLVDRYLIYQTMIQKFNVSLDYQGAHKMARKLYSDCDGGCGCDESIAATSETSSGCTAPTIVTQPVATAVNAGQDVVLSVIASGTATLYYQWKKNGVTLPGEVSSTLNLYNVGVADEANYSVLISNTCGQILSANAAVSLTPDLIALTITLHPVSVTQAAGSTAIFTVAATGSPAITYQWRKNGVNIVGETGTTLTLLNIDAGDEADYDVVVTNPVGSLNSNVATLTLGLVALYGWRNTPPAILADVEALQGSIAFNSGDDITADFRANADPMYLVMAEPSTEPLKTKWYGDINNNGNIGNVNTDLFGPPVIIGGYRVYTTVYKTFNTQVPLQFLVN
jgi:hypothetical protein